MKQVINTDQWKRTSAFSHFIAYSNPYFGISTHVDCTNAYAKAKELGVSFFLYYFYLSLQAANEIPEFRMRIEDGQPVIHDKVNGSPTIQRTDGEMGYAMLEYKDNFEDFLHFAQIEIERVKTLPHLDTSKDCPETIYYSIIPWIDFTAVDHPMDRHNLEGVPILTFGKMTDKDGRKIMPLAVHAHHALMDGKHIAEFIEGFQRKLSLI